MSTRNVWGVLLLSLATARLSPAAAAGGIRAVTRPSADITLSFVQPGRIACLPFKEGDPVEAGQVLIRQDDTAEQILLAQLKAQAQDSTRVQAADASLAQKRVDLVKLEKAASSNAATPLEVEHARLDVTIADLSLELARFEHEQAARKYQEEEARVDRMRLKSPIDGRIEQVHVEVGESVNALADVVRVVRTDPLWIDAPVPLPEAAGLKPGMTARIRVTGSEQNAGAGEGQIIFVGAVADAASGTLRVRIELPNQANRPAGEHVLVEF
ncbi:MAG: efflux RND transporter periplasmic adaptor subunit [Phycisphaerales bacterium]|jgi:membrane fusion protein (multidrug efflux system)